MSRFARRILRALAWTVGIAVVVLALGAGALWLAAREAMGGRVDDVAQARHVRSAQWSDGAFRNRLPRVDGSPTTMVRKFLFGGSDYRTPDGPLPVAPRSATDYRTPPASGLRVTWLGHSTMLLEIDGGRVLIDPVWGERASPFGFMGPKRFSAPPLPLADLPAIDAVVLSHDHYDHLDMPTVKALATRRVRWVVPLGVGVHLRAWGVRAADVTELDWWEAVRVADLTLAATPARHFSGRGLNDAGRTLWAGWVIAGARHRAFYSGDTSLHPELVEIGARLGPFDLTMIEAGAYDAMWADVHLGPEQAVHAHRLVRGGVMLPVHWGLFDLALHGWTEPMERVLVAAEREGVRVASPRPGDMVEPAALGPVQRWWPQLPWDDVAKAPAWSSGVTALRQRSR